MDHRDDHDAKAIAAAFLNRYLADQRAGRPGSLRQYQDEYPGFETVIAEEYQAIQIDEREPQATGPRDATASTSRYGERGEIARGGMGTVYRVRDLDLDRTLAMKVLRGSGDRSTASPQRLTRFLQEAQINAQLDHPGVVPVHELGIDEAGELFFSMSLVRGSTLAQILAKSQGGDPDWPLPRVVRLLQRVSETVAYAHDRGVVHRDLKPANVMVGRFGETYVMDWGLATIHGDATGSAAIDSSRRDLAGAHDAGVLATRVGDVLGTPAYMAPEQARGETTAIAPPTDVYAIGAMLYELLAGRPPFAGDADDVIDALRDGAAVPVDGIDRDAPVELVAICAKATALDPGDRYETAIDLAADLSAFLEQRVVSAHESGALAELRKWIARNRAPAAAAAIAIFVLAAAVVLGLWLGERERAATARANDNSRLAIAAVNDMLTKVAGHELRNVPQVDDLRRSILTDAVAMLDGLHADRPQPSSNVLFDTLRHVAWLQRSLGEHDAAIEAAERRVALIEARLTAGPAEDRLRWHLVSALYTSAVMLGEGRDVDAGTAVARRGIALAEELNARSPASAEQRKSWLRLVDFLANLREQAGDADEARALFQGVFQQWRDLAAKKPEQRHEYLLALADSLGTYARVLASRKELQRAEEHYDEAFTVFDRVIDAAPGEVEPREFRIHHAVAYSAMVLMEQRRFAEMTEFIPPLIAELEDLIKRFPTRLPLQVTSGGALSNLGWALLNEGRSDDAFASFLQAQAILRDVLAVAPTDVQARRFIVSAHGNACMLLARADRFEDLAAQADALESVPRPDRRSRSILAEALARCAGGMPEDLREGFAQRALTTLSALVDAGLRDARFFDRPAFAALRGRPEFATLRERCGGKR